MFLTNMIIIKLIMVYAWVFISTSMNKASSQEMKIKKWEWWTVFIPIMGEIYLFKLWGKFNTTYKNIDYNVYSGVGTKKFPLRHLDKILFVLILGLALYQFQIMYVYMTGSIIPEHYYEGLESVMFKKQLEAFNIFFAFSFFFLCGALKPYISAVLENKEQALKEAQSKEKALKQHHRFVEETLNSGRYEIPKN